MKEINDEGINGFVDIAWYNGTLEIIDHILDNLAFAVEQGIEAVKPDWYKIYSGRTDELAETFWMWLVLLYGNYGTSPRSGWIDKMYTEPLYETISECMSQYKDSIY